jgi:hypothetical protein
MFRSLDAVTLGDQVGATMTRRLTLALVLAAPLVSAVAFAAPRATHGQASIQTADPQCGGPNKPDEGPKPPKEPPKT